MAEVETEDKSCLVCYSGKLEQSRKWIKIQNDIGKKPKDVFLKICEVLQVSFVEIQQDWHFGEDGCFVDDGRRKSNPLPFCGACLSDFSCVVKLQLQLIDIQKKIDDNVVSIREKIQKSITTTPLHTTNLRANNFRSKALLVASRRHPFITSASSDLLPSSTDVTTANSKLQQFNSCPPVPVAASFSQVLSSTYNSPCTMSAPAVATAYNQNVTASSSYSFLFSNLDPVSRNQSLNNFSTDQTSQYPESKFQSTQTQPPPPPPVPTYNHQQQQSNNSDTDDNCDYGNESNESEEEADYQENFRSQSTTITKNNVTFIQSKRKRSGIQSSSSATSNQNKSGFNAGGVGGAKGQPEYFSPVHTDAQGRMVFEGITITPAKTGGYTCGKCGATVGKKQDSIALRKTKIHIKGFHLGAYKCFLCDKNFTSNDIMNQHLARFHGVKQVPCPDCGKPIKNPSSLIHHQFTHKNAAEKQVAVASGYTPPPRFPCRTCEKSFSARHKLNKHELNHGDTKLRKDFNCQFCKKAFVSKHGHDAHVALSHNVNNSEDEPGKLCKVCGETFTSRDYPTHVRQHTRVRKKPHLCRICNKKAFSKKGLLEAHQRACAKEQEQKKGYKFECDICNDVFLTRRKMLTHRRSEHQSHWKFKVPNRLEQDISVDNPRDGPDFLLDDLNNEGIQHVDGNVYSYQLYEIEKLLQEKEGFRLKCRTCLEEFHDKDEDQLEEKVKSHIRLQHIGSFKCNTCTKRMKSLYEVQAHINSEHLNAQTYNCGLCGNLGISRKIITMHKWAHKSVREAVEAVNEGAFYPRTKDYHKTDEMHSLLMGMGVTVEIKCGICEETGFEKVGDLFGHRLGKHPEAPVKKAVIKTEPKKKGRKRVYPEEDPPVDCEICRKTYGNRDKLRKHKYKVHNKRINKQKQISRSSRKKVQPASEDEEGEEEIEWNTKFGCNHKEIVIKEEVNTSDNSEDESEVDMFGGDEEDDHRGMEKKRNVKQSMKTTGKVNRESLKGRRRSVRNLRVKRQTVSYAEKWDDDEESEEEEELKIKQCPESSDAEWMSD